MTAPAPTPPRDPVAHTPPLAAGVFRRTSHVDVGPATGDRWMQPSPVRLAFRGRIRDHAIDEEPERSAELAAVTDSHRVLVEVETTPAVEPFGLLGQRVGPGFRRVVEDAHAAPEREPVSVLLFDLPTGALIAGYAEIRSRTLAGISPGDIMGPAVLPYVEEVCAGWATDGHMVTSIRGGEGIPIQDCPDAPSLGDGWHPIPALDVGWLRRRRRIDLAPDGVIDAMFRDSYAEPDGRETVLHEYAVTGAVDADGVVTALNATPRVLPFGECPLASRNVDRLLGSPGRDLRRAVRDHLAGTAGCTHMNDLLASIGDVLAARSP